MSFSPLLNELIQSLRCLPGVGPKSAQRMALYLLERNREGARYLSNILRESIERVGHCQRCRILCETELCDFCGDEKRQTGQLCIVETPADVLAIESTGQYRGLYYVLSGYLSPIDGIGPAEIGLDVLAARLGVELIQEIILAINPTVEGEVTSYYIAEMVKNSAIKVSRIAYGLPVGGALEYADGSTIAKALMDRSAIPV